MPDRIPSIRPKALIRILERHGFILRRTTGSHAILRQPKTKRMVVVPIHAKDLKRGLLFGILKQAQISEQAFRAFLK